MLELKIFIFKLLTIDRFATSSVASSEVTTLKHELLNDPMEDGALCESFSILMDDQI